MPFVMGRAKEYSLNVSLYILQFAECQCISPQGIPNKLCRDVEDQNLITGDRVGLLTPLLFNSNINRANAISLVRSLSKYNVDRMAIEHRWSVI